MDAVPDYAFDYAGSFVDWSGSDGVVVYDPPVRSPAKVGGRVFDRAGTQWSPHEFSRAPSYVGGPKPSPGWANPGDAPGQPYGHSSGFHSAPNGGSKRSHYIPAPRAVAGYDPADVSQSCDRCGAAAARYGSPPWCARCAGSPPPPEFFGGRREHLSGGREWEGTQAWLDRDAIYGASWDPRPHPWPVGYEKRRSPCLTYSGSSDCGDAALHADHFSGSPSEPKSAARLEGQVATLRIIIIVMAFVLLVMGAMLVAQRAPALFVGVGMPAPQRGDKTAATV